jgi:peptidoglycan biosynthesis protein MviN/MurJ (putative lipid II flippase)
MPHINLSPCGTPLPQRSRGEIIATFLVLPLVMGLALLAGLVLGILLRQGGFDWRDGLSLAWTAFLLAGLLIGLPATGLRELLRRKRAARPS